MVADTEQFSWYLIYVPRYTLFSYRITLLNRVLWFDHIRVSKTAISDFFKKRWDDKYYYLPKQYRCNDNEDNQREIMAQ